MTRLAVAEVCGRCHRATWSRGLCMTHYTRLYRAGLLDPLMVDVTVTRRRINRFLAAGESRASIARAAGVHVDTVSLIAAGRRQRVLETVALAIAAAIPQPRQES